MATKRYVVWSIRKESDGTCRTKAGQAFRNADGSINVYLEALPLDGMLQLREEASTADAEMESTQ